MTRRIGWIGSLAWFAGAMSGCGGSTGDSPAAIDAACVTLAAVVCAKLDACQKNGVAAAYGDVATCQTRQKAICVTRHNAASTSVTVATTQLCAAAYPGAACADFLGGNIANCQTHAGGLATGMPCAFDGQCQTTFCQLTKNGNCGVCAALSLAGNDCSMKSCSHGFTCQTTTSLCQPTGVMGTTCDPDHACGVGLTCVTSSTMTTSGTCQPEGAMVGAACDNGRVTVGYCDFFRGLFCDQSSKKCASLTYASPNAACGYMGMGMMPATDATCTGASACLGMKGALKCLPRAAEGAACNTDATIGPSCMAPARCVTGSPTTPAGTCQISDPATCK